MLKDRLLSLFTGVFIFFSLTSFQNTPDNSQVKKLKDGVLVYPDPLYSGNTKIVKLQVINNYIIRVTASPDREISETKSLIVIDQQTAGSFSLQEEKENVIIRTSSLEALVSKRNGRVQFNDVKGHSVLSEKPEGRRFEPAIYEGQHLWHISQIFQTRTDDAYYGLGQHQDGQYDYKGGRVELFQNNTEVGIPFLLSRNNYGILWDNCSLTSIGDKRPYRTLSALKLYDKEDNQGWLSASYYNDINAKKPDVVRPESTIEYEYLNDLKTGMPAEFKPANGKVEWEGSFSSGVSGLHHLRFTYAGYFKLWVNGDLKLDRWRQAWNPGSAIVELNLEKDRKYTVKIEWIPNGGESYISAKCLEPVPPEEVNDYCFSSEAGKILDYYFIAGKNMDEVIRGYRTLTGKATLIPKWALGFWQSRERYKTQDEILSTVDEFRKRKIPIDNIVEDWSYWKENDWGSQEFDQSRFPSPDSMISELHNKYHTHFMISVWPKFYEGISAYREFDKNRWLYRRNIADRQRDWIAQGYVSTFYDAFNPAARNGFWALINKKLFSKGVDAWWMDASEPDILSNVSPEKRIEQMSPTALGPSAEYLNAYPLENARGIYEGQRDTRPDQRAFILTRSAFAGSQRYAAATWSGDIAARWHDMKSQIAAGLNFSMSGIPYWTMDIGGFAVERRYEHPSAEDLEEWREQMTRWYQFGAFAPLFRVHGQYPYREIYNTAPENHPAYQSMLYYDYLRYRLMPYIYSLAGMAYHNDYTFMRGLVMDFPKDTAVVKIADQYLFGPSLLINPVYEYKSRERKVYLPGGQGWYDLYTGKYEQGGRTISAAAPYERMPVYVKEGSIIPFGPELQYTAEKPADTITLYVYAGKDARFTLYEDDGLNYDYENGKYSNIPITYSENNRTLTIGKREGSFPGMLAQRIFNIVWINKNQPLSVNNKPEAMVRYTGNLTTVKMNFR